MRAAASAITFISVPERKLVGDAKIGSNVVIAANSLVLTDVRDNMMVMGVPARIKLPGGRPQRFVKKPEAVAAPVAAQDCAGYRHREAAHTHPLLPAYPHIKALHRQSSRVSGPERKQEKDKPWTLHGMTSKPLFARKCCDLPKKS